MCIVVHVGSLYIRFRIEVNKYDEALYGRQSLIWRAAHLLSRANLPHTSATLLPPRGHTPIPSPPKHSILLVVLLQCSLCCTKITYCGSFLHWTMEHGVEQPETTQNVFNLAEAHFLARLDIIIWAPGLKPRVVGTTPTQRWSALWDLWNLLRESNASSP